MKAKILGNTSGKHAELIRWDWKDAPQREELQEALNALQGTKIYTAYANTNADYYCLVLANFEIDEIKATELLQMVLKSAKKHAERRRGPQRI